MACVIINSSGSFGDRMEFYYPPLRYFLKVTILLKKNRACLIAV